MSSNETAKWPRRVVHWIRRDTPLVILDSGAIFAAYFLALALRFDGVVPAKWVASFVSFSPLVLLVHLTSSRLFGLYGQMWRYVSIREARRVVLSGVAAGFVVVLVATSPFFDRPLPLSVAMMGATLSIVALGGIRFQSRLFGLRRRYALGEAKNVLIVGGGEAGVLLLKDLQRDTSLGRIPVAVVDDDPRKSGRSIHGVPVMGFHSQIPEFVDRFDVREVLLAIPSAPSELVREIADECEKADVPLRVLPALREMVGDRVTARDIRDLKIEDLLGRDQKEIDLKAVEETLKGKRILITGAGGSIGSEIARQVTSFSPAELILLDHDETHLFDLVLDLQQLETDFPIHQVLADVRSPDGLLDTFMSHHPEVVFHAAAHKHVPLLEVHPAEALRTNAIGTANVVDAALATKVERFVFISTDKAIRPTSVMGASKWLAEQLVRSVEPNGSVYCAVRFGNVLGSRGSVIPTFLRQIAHQGPVTVTDPSMIRYFMSVEEAVQLVLQAGALSRGGEVFTLDMGEPVNILELAKKLIRLSGSSGKDIPIEVIGARPGEKLVEEIVDDAEEVLPSDHPSITVSRSIAPDRGVLKQALWKLDSLAVQGRSEELAEEMKTLARDGIKVVTLT